MKIFIFIDKNNFIKYYENVIEKYFYNIVKMHTNVSGICNKYKYVIL